MDITKHTEKLIMSGDGFSTGTGKPDFKGRRGITIQEVPWLCNKVNDAAYAGLEILIRYTKGHANGTYEEFDTSYGGYEIASKCAKMLDLPSWLPPQPPPPENPTDEPKKPIETPSPPPERLSWFQKCLKGLKRAFRWFFGPNSLIRKLFKKKT
jgi:hypothetical protein